MSSATFLVLPAGVDWNEMDNCIFNEAGNHSQVTFVPWVMNVLSGLGKVHVH
jgi:hypothetical protein